MIGELYDYKGEKLTQAQIAKRENINRSTLADWYKKTGNMEEAVIGAKKSQAQRNISYYDEVLSLKAISNKEKIKFESLKKNYDETGDIYEAVRLTKESQKKRQGDIFYKGKMMTALAIANEEGIDAKSLRKNITITNNIEEAVKLTKEARDKHRGTIPYKGQIMSISGIANLEGVKHGTLKEYYDLYGNIDKAVLITKESQLKRKKAILRGKQATYDELSKYLGVSKIKLEKMISDGYTPDEIEKKQKKGRKKEEQLQYDDKSLYNYCLEHSYNYWVINYLIKVYGKTPEEAINGYVNNGQQIPTKWIYEKYNILFKHLMLHCGLDSNRIIKIMKDNCCNVETAIQELVLVSNNDTTFKKAEIDWLKELYPFLKELSREEFEEAKQTFYIDDRELEFLSKKDKKIKELKRQLLLFEFSQVITIWPKEELLTMMDMYNISPEEKKTIVLDLYTPFNNKIIDMTKDFNREKELNAIVLDESILTDNLSYDEKKYVEEKRKMITLLNSSKDEIGGHSFY